MRLRFSFQQLSLVAGIVLGAGGMAFGGYRLWQLRHPPVEQVVAPDADCDLQRGACGATLPGGGRLTLAIAPRPIPLIEPLAIEVRVDGARSRAVEVDFSSPDMYMGYNRRALEAAGAGVYAGKAVLPVCIRTRMAWRARVVADTERGRVSVPFLFVTDAQGARK
jgi:hypothetical protein